MRCALLLLLLACAGVALAADTASAPAETPSPATAPAAAPAESDIAAQQQAIRNLYKTDYANHDPAKRTELARQLIGLSDSGTAAERIALLREAVALAGGVGDLDLAHTAFDTIVHDWSVDADSERLALYKAVVVTTPDQAASAASDLLAASTAAINADHYTMAQKLAEAAGGFARKTGDEAVTTRAKTLAAQARDLGADYYKITDQADMLGNLTPEQDAALGRFYALAKCDWTKALPLFVQGNDAVLKGLAVDDQAAATGPDHEAIGERWIAYAKKVTAKQRPGLIRRGLDHLTQAADAATGLAKARLDQRIAELQRQAGMERGTPEVPPGVVLWLSGDAGPDGQTVVDRGPSHLPVEMDGKLLLLREGHGGFMRFSGNESLTVTLKTQIAPDSALSFTCWLRYAGKAVGSLFNLYPPDGMITVENEKIHLLVTALPGFANGKPFFPQVYVTGMTSWHHLAFVLDPLRNATWYIDGVVTGEVADTMGPLAAPIDKLQIGVARENLIGDLDSIGVWKRALSADEVKALYTAGASGRPAPAP